MAVDRLNFRDDLSTSSDYLRMAVPQMIKRKIPPTPHNYALWYAHVQNDNPELSKALLAQFPEGGVYDHEKSEALFFEIFVKGHLPDSNRAQHLLANLLAQVGKAVAKSSAGARDYGNSLQEAMAVCDQDLDQDALREILGQLLEDTATVQNLNQALQNELQSASAEVSKLKQELERSQQHARFDALTKIPNRRAFDDALAQALASRDEPACLLLLDLDRFKACNDTYGHLMGDRVLETLGEILAQLQSDRLFVSRFGGEEFAAIWAGPMDEAREVAEQIRLKVAAIRITNRQTQEILKPLSVSIGVARARGDDTPEQLIARADAALYQAKDQGRNRVITEDLLAAPA